MSRAEVGRICGGMDPPLLFLILLQRACDPNITHLDLKRASFVTIGADTHPKCTIPSLNATYESRIPSLSGETRPVYVRQHADENLTSGLTSRKDEMQGHMR